MPPRLHTSSIRGALLSPLSLVLLGSGGVAAVALHSVPVAAIGAVSYLAMVAWELVKPEGEPAAPRRSTPVPLPDPQDIPDPATADHVRAILRARAERAKTLAVVPEAVRGTVGSALTGVAELERHAVSLVARAEELRAYLAGQDGKRLRAELVELRGRVESAADATVRANYARALAAKEGQAKALEDIAGAREGVLSNLARIAATLEGLPPRLMRLRALDEEAMDSLGGEVGRELEELNGEMHLFESTLSSLSIGAGP